MTTLAFVYRNTNKINQAISQLQIVLDSCRSKKKLFWEGLTLGNIANCYYLQKKYDEAIPFAQKDAHLSRDAGEILSMVRSQILLGNIYILKNQLQNAYPYFDSVRTSLNQLLIANPENDQTFYNDLKDLNIGLGEYYYLTGNYIQSSKCFAESYRLTDSINKQKASDEYRHILQRFEMDRNDAEISRLKIDYEKQNAIMDISIILSLALLIILILFIYFYKRISQKNRLLEEKAESSICKVGLSKKCTPKKIGYSPSSVMT